MCGKEGGEQRAGLTWHGATQGTPLWMRARSAITLCKTLPMAAVGRFLDCGNLFPVPILSTGNVQGTGRRITCLDVHPSRPHLCATGSSAATAAVWDLRFQAAPVSRSAGPTCHGDATDVSDITALLR